MSALNRTFVGRLLVVAAVMGTSQASGQAVGRGPARTEMRGVVKSLDAAAGSITVSVSERDQPVAERSYPLAKDVEVVVGDGADRRSVFVLKEGKLADLAAGVSVTLSLSAGNAVVESIVAERPMVRGLLKTVDTAKNTIAVSVQPAQRGEVRREQALEEKSYALAPGVEIAVDDGRGSRFSVKEGKVADLAAGATVTLRLSLDQKQVVSAQAEGPNVFGVIKSHDPGKNTLTLSLGPSRGGEAASEQTLDLAGDAVVLVDDGRGRRLSLKEGKLADVPVGAVASLRLSVDQRFVTLVRAEGPSLGVLIKAADSSNGTVTFATRVGRGENPEQKTLPVAKDARIVIDGNEGKLADIKVAENGPFATLRLSLDQKAIQGIMAGAAGGGR